MLGWELDDLLTQTIAAMAQAEDQDIAESNRLTGL